MINRKCTLNYLSKNCKLRSHHNTLPYLRVNKSSSFTTKRISDNITTNE